MKLLYLLPICALATLLSGCAKEPAQEYKLSAEQLAWQPYRTGDVLRFGHDKDSQVRTYRITEVQDRMEEAYQPYNWLPFSQSAAPLYQFISVAAQRTDSAGQVYNVLDLSLYHSLEYRKLELRADASWEMQSGVLLPIDSVIAGTRIDTLYYPGIKFLSTVRLGPTTYSQVLFARNQRPNQVAPGSKPNRYLYYAKGNGIVGFQEDGTGLWYRVP